jgi:glucose uptake protein GlcU
MSFVWIFSSGVFVVGIISMFIAKKAIFIYSGILGGSLWATGNLCVIPIVKTIGLGPGMLLWGSTSLLTGFLTGKFGIFHLEKQSVPHNAMNWLSMGFVVLSMIVFFFIKPTIETLPKHKREEEEEPLTKGGDIQQEGPADGSFVDQIPAAYRNIIGGALAIGSGMLYGVNMVPMMLWTQKEQREGRDPGPLDFVFSHFAGIYLYSTAIFVLYCLYNCFYGRPPKIFPEAALPSMISGAMWGIAQCGLMSATQILGYTVGFPIGSAGPIIVSSLWSVLYFREIRGVKNLCILGLSFALLFTGIILLALSKQEKL